MPLDYYSHRYNPALALRMGVYICVDNTRKLHIYIYIYLNMHFLYSRPCEDVYLHYKGEVRAWYIEEHVGHITRDAGHDSVRIRRM